MPQIIPVTPINTVSQSGLIRGMQMLQQALIPLAERKMYLDEQKRRQKYNDSLLMGRAIEQAMGNFGNTITQVAAMRANKDQAAKDAAGLQSILGTLANPNAGLDSRDWLTTPAAKPIQPDNSVMKPTLTNSQPSQTSTLDWLQTSPNLTGGTSGQPSHQPFEATLNNSVGAAIRSGMSPQLGQSILGGVVRQKIDEALSPKYSPQSLLLKAHPEFAFMTPEQQNQYLNNLVDSNSKSDHRPQKTFYSDEFSALPDNEKQDWTANYRVSIRPRPAGKAGTQGGQSKEEKDMTAESNLLAKSLSQYRSTNRGLEFNPLNSNELLKKDGGQEQYDSGWRKASSVELRNWARMKKRFDKIGETLNKNADVFSETPKLNANQTLTATVNKPSDTLSNLEYEKLPSDWKAKYDALPADKKAAVSKSIRKNLGW